MNPITTLTFTGADGSKYRFSVYPKNIRVNSGPALYSFLKKTDGKYYVLYIGKSEDLAQRLSDHHKWDEAGRLGFEFLAICRGVRAGDLEAAEATLIRQYRPRCNEVVPR